MLYTYIGGGSTDVSVPLYDIFGSTIDLIDPSNPSTFETTYTYDPYGVVTTPNNVRTPWPFLYHGLEQQYPDSWKLDWEPGGNVYNPDPFQLSLSGPQGLGGGGGAAPRSIIFGTQHAAVNWVGISLGVAQNIAGVLDPDVISIGSDPPLNIVSPYDPFNLLAGLFQGGIPTIPWYDTTHTSRGVHDIYPYVGIQNIVDQSPSAGKAKYYRAPNGKSFAVPENADLCGELQAGQNNKFSLGHPWQHVSSMRKAVGQGGTFDYQRWGGKFNSNYTDASNFGVGVYMNGAGYSQFGMDVVGGTYSLFWSRNANAASQQEWWVQGWIAANNGEVCH